ncbi:MAG: ATP-binding protein [Actinomycetota bacterium]|nr:ATP-binding protein [Actinomycetota bacterium]
MRGTGWPAGRLVAVGIAIMTLFSVVAIVIGALALAGLSNARSQVVTRLDPASFQGSQLEVALLNQETGVRGYALSGQRVFVQPYALGLAGQKYSVLRLHQVLAGDPQAEAEVGRVLSSASDWRTGYAIPVMRAVQATGKAPASPGPQRGKADFDSIRVSLTELQTDISAQRHRALTSLADATDTLDVAFTGIAAGLLLIVIMLTIGVRRTTITPLARLAADARQVADGDFGHELSQRGPREVRDLGADVDSMRERILSELSAVRAANTSLGDANTSLEAANTSLEQRSHDLQRSNSELEQFAYVASHDLQEPLRKVASFCQLLQRRYGGQLDEKADQYIEYAVDGAKRMQMLINDLLAFSRVGRVEQERVPVPAADLLTQAQANLATAMRRARAEVGAGELPTVLAEPTLLTAVFQNLLSNAIKFRGERAPRVTVTAGRDGDFWVFSVADNGIGINSEYAERIFVIFQRLHDKTTYPGTGIGLAMTRKIIEYHGGRIWLDATAASGARFCFTLPVIPQVVAGGNEPVSEGEAVSDETDAVSDSPDIPAETTAPPDTVIPDLPARPEDEEADD